MRIVRSASSRMVMQLPGLPMLKIRREAQPSLFSMMRSSASIASSMKVNERLCLPPSTSWIGFLKITFEMNCVKRRELPSLGSSTSSSFGPIQLNGRNSV